MSITWKKIRYTYWLTSAFIRKNIQPIVLSFLLSIIGIIAIVSFSPYLIKALSTKEEAIGIAGTYTIATLPDSVLSKISNGLLYINEKGEVKPLIAESWQEVKKGEVYRFQLKKDLTWSDGKPFLAEDVNYNFKEVDKKIEGGLTFSYNLQKSLPIFPTFLTRPLIRYPLIGLAGTYKVEKAKIEQGIVKELQLTPQPNPDRPDLPIIIYRFYDTETKLINAYKLGEITQMTTNKKSIADNFKSWKNTKIERSIDYTKVMTLFFNMDNPLLKEDKDIRHAIAMAIDKRKLEDMGAFALGPLPPTSWAYQPPTKQYTYNPELADKLLKKYTTGTQSASLTISTFYDNLASADILNVDIGATGLKTRVEVLESIQGSTFDMFLAQMQLSQDPDQYFFWHSTQTKSNISHYKNVRIDKILEDGRKTFDVEEHKKVYADFQRILNDDMPADFLYYPYVYTISRK